VSTVAETGTIITTETIEITVSTGKESTTAKDTIVATTIKTQDTPNQLKKTTTATGKFCLLQILGPIKNLGSSIAELQATTPPVSSHQRSFLI
jgi:hypothetical protein